jgi:uncharacterized protein
MPTVSNTSPISNLAIIGHLDLLRLQFSEVWIPQGVAEELGANPNSLALSSIREALHAGWLKTSTTPNPVLLKILLPVLHRGEGEAISLAIEMKAETVIIDEQEGRLIATQAGLSFTGVLGILLRAKRTGTISSVRA